MRRSLGHEQHVAGRQDSALRRTMSTAGRTVLFSGLTVAAALSSLLIFPQTFLKSMGYGGVVVDVFNTGRLARF